MHIQLRFKQYLFKPNSRDNASEATTHVFGVLKIKLTTSPFFAVTVAGVNTGPSGATWTVITDAAAIAKSAERTEILVIMLTCTTVV